MQDESHRETPTPRSYGPVGRAQGVLWCIGLAVRRFMLRTGRGPLRPVWALAHELFLKLLASWLRHDLDTSVYVKGTHASGDAVFGLSDIDLVVVAPAVPNQPARARGRIERRWKELCSRVNPLAWVVSEVYAYEDAELRDVSSATCFTYGLERPGVGPSAFYGPRHRDEAGLLIWPGLWPTREWRLLAGPERRPRVVPDNPDHRRLASWLMLQSWWRYAFDASLDPDLPHIPYRCVKLVAEPARMLLWLKQGVQIFRRRDVLERAVELIPEERSSFQRALELLDELHRSPPAPLHEFLPMFLRLSSRVAETITAGAAHAGVTEVRLRGGDRAMLLVPPFGGEERLLPLVDWRTRVRPRPGDEAFFPVPGDPSRPDQLAAATRTYRPGVYPALRAGDLLILASGRGGRRELRTVQCAVSDPVSFAVMASQLTASFPRVPGWSALDSARRAVAEHRAWLDEHWNRLSTGKSKGAQSLAMLLSAARAASFLESLEEEPELTLTLAATAECLARREPGAAVAAEEGFAAYREAVTDEREVPEATVRALSGAVRRLPAYRSPVPLHD
jgi:predicted nucleotidyltransferase